MIISCKDGPLTENSKVCFGRVCPLPYHLEVFGEEGGGVVVVLYGFLGSELYLFLLSTNYLGYTYY